MLQNPCKTLGFKKNMVYEIPAGGGKPYPASGLRYLCITLRGLIWTTPAGDVNLSKTFNKNKLGQFSEKFLF